MQRKTLNFENPVTWLRDYATQGTVEHRALVRVIGEPAYVLTSESAVLVSLVEYAHARVEEEKLRILYDEAYSDQARDPDSEMAMDVLEADYAEFVEQER